MVTQDRELEACLFHRDTCFGSSHLWLWDIYMTLDQLDSPGGYQFFLLGEQGAFLAIKM